VSSVDASSVLSREQREQFERDGILLLADSGCGPTVLDGVVAELEDLYEGDGVKRRGVVYYSRRIQDAWRVNEKVRALALSSRIREILIELYGREPLPFQTLNFRLGTEQAVHSDTIHFNSKPPGFMCGVWVALEDIDMDNGPLVYYPGSHRLPQFTMNDAGADARSDEYPLYERFIADEIERRGLEPAYGTIRKGEVLIWAANVLHGGIRQRDPARTRHSQVTHYFFEDCSYYTPMLSGEGHVESRDPVWVSEEVPEDEDGGYDARLIRETVLRIVPEGATVLVVDKGDEELSKIRGRRTRHFPRNPDGTPAWHDPADSTDLLDQVAREREAGAEYLLIPSASAWWLDYYEAFTEHLERECRALARDSDCALFEL
jgi:hypothetical protein